MVWMVSRQDYPSAGVVSGTLVVVAGTANWGPAPRMVSCSVRSICRWISAAFGT